VVKCSVVLSKKTRQVRTSSSCTTNTSLRQTMVLAILLTLHLAMVMATSIQPYKIYSVEALCKNTREKVSLDLNNQAHVFIFNTTNKELLTCHLELHLHADSLGFAVFTEVMKLESTKDCTKDFVQFGRDFLLFTSHKSAKKCGTIEPTKRILRDDGSLYDIDYKATTHQAREYIEAEDKEMDIWLSIHPPRLGQSRKELKLIVTPFKKSCVVSDHYYRKCPGTNKCIKQELFCDGIINCDGAPKDEQEEYCLFFFQYWQRRYYPQYSYHHSHRRVLHCWSHVLDIHYKVVHTCNEAEGEGASSRSREASSSRPSLNISLR